MKKLTILWLTLAAIAVPVWAIAQQYRNITVYAAAEDDCAYFYGAYALAEVEPLPEPLGVNCLYRN